MKGKIRLGTLAFSVVAALLCGTAALTQGPAVAAEPSGELSAASLGAGEDYLLQEENGKVFVFYQGRPWKETDIDPNLLRVRDRQALQEGIAVGDLESLLKLIEDFNS